MHDAGALPVYRHFLGSSFDLLPRELQAFHAVTGERRFTGRCTLAGAETWFGRAVACLLRLPRAGEGAMSFHLLAAGDTETWRRHFPGTILTSCLRFERGLLVERMGAAALGFAVGRANGDELSLVLTRVHLFGIPVPCFLHPQVRAVETASPGQLHFDVAAGWPRVGRIIAYRGTLDIDPGERIA